MILPSLMMLPTLLLYIFPLCSGVCLLVPLTGIELTMRPGWLGIQQRSACLYFLGAWIKGRYHHALPLVSSLLKLQKQKIFALTKWQRQVHKLNLLCVKLKNMRGCVLPAILSFPYSSGWQVSLGQCLLLFHVSIRAFFLPPPSCSAPVLKVVAPVKSLAVFSNSHIAFRCGTGHWCPLASTTAPVWVSEVAAAHSTKPQD